MEDEQEEPDIEDINQSYYDEQADYSENYQEGLEDQHFGNYPGQSIKDSIFTFFNNLLKIKNSKKVANLDKKELGMLNLSVRQCEYLSLIGEILGDESYKDFFRGKAEITLATSMSKKGWLPELVISQKRYSQRGVTPVLKPKQKKPFLGIGGSKSQEQQ